MQSLHYLLEVCDRVSKNNNEEMLNSINYIFFYGERSVQGTKSLDFDARMCCLLGDSFGSSLSRPNYINRKPFAPFAIPI